MCSTLMELWSNVLLGTESNLSLQQDVQQRECLSFLGLCPLCMCLKYAGVTGETHGSLTEREGLWRGAVRLQPN